MTDSALKNAERRIEAVGARMNEIDGKIRMLEDERDTLRSEKARAEAFIQAWHAFDVIEPDDLLKRMEAPVSEREPAREPVGKSSRAKNPKKEEVAKVAREILITHGSPMNRSELFEALQASGVEIWGKEPEMVLSTMLWRMKGVIVRLQPHGYWAADSACPRVGYSPGAQDEVTENANSTA